MQDYKTAIKARFLIPPLYKNPAKHHERGPRDNNSRVLVFDPLLQRGKGNPAEPYEQVGSRDRNRKGNPADHRDNDKAVMVGPGNTNKQAQILDPHFQRLQKLKFQKH